MKNNQPIIARDFSRGNVRIVQNSISPRNSVKMALNMNSDEELGSLVSRKGTDLVGAQTVASATCYGLHYYRDSTSSNHTLFGVFSDGSNNDIYDMSDASKSLEDDTKELKTRFVTYLNDCLRMNGTDAAKAFNGTSWYAANSATCTFENVGNTVDDVAHGLSNGDIVKFSTTGTLPAELSINTAYYVVNKNNDDFQVSATSGGSAIDLTDDGTGTHTWEEWDTFDLVNIPATGSLLMEWKDRIYMAGDSSNPNKLYYSGIADPDIRAISWTDGNGSIEIEQEDGGGDITALEKVPGYMLIFKERSMKRWNGNSTFPDDLINVGAPSQEAICRGQGNVFIANQEGVWITNGGYPQRISRPIQDLWDAIPAANISSIATYCDERYVYVYVGDITLGDNTYSNIMFKYNLEMQTWDIYSYHNDFSVFTWYLDSNERVVVGGDKDGQALKLNSGYTDYDSTEQPITWTVETQDIDINTRGQVKEVSEMIWFTKNVKVGSSFYRVNSDRDKDWESIGNIVRDVEDQEFKAKGNWFNFKSTGVADTGQVKVQGFEIPKQAVETSENARQ